MPPHRWFLIGPKRSGSEIHQDPLGTSAWNTSVQGYKRWILVPPDHNLTKKFMRAKHLMNKGEDDEAIHYFDFIWPRLKMQEYHSLGKIPGLIECIQYPGETMFVPGAWWHAVLNLDTTIAITENVCNAGNFDRVWLHTRQGRKRLAYKWLHQLRSHHPDLFNKAICLNLRDKHLMWTPPLTKEKKEMLMESPYIDSEDSDGSDLKDDSISSSTSSDSSDESEDDMMPIADVLNGVKTLESYPDLKQIIYPEDKRESLKFVLLVR